MLAIRHETPYWLPRPLFDGSVTIIQHGLRERCDHGEDYRGVKWERKVTRADSFPVNHPLDSPDMVEDYPLPSLNKSRIMECAKKAASNIDRNRVVLVGDNE